MSRFLRRTEVEELTGLARSTIYTAMARGAFPRPVRWGKRAVRWRLDDIEQWFASRPTAIPGGDRPPECRSEA